MGVFDGDFSELEAAVLAHMGPAERETVERLRKVYAECEAKGYTREEIKRQMFLNGFTIGVPDEGLIGSMRKVREDAIAKLRARIKEVEDDDDMHYNDKREILQDLRLDIKELEEKPL